MVNAGCNSFMENYDDLLEYQEDILTPKDINDLNWCQNNDIDSICIPNLRNKDDIINVRNILGNKKKNQIFSKIQNSESLLNFEEIAKNSDGIIIARGYLTLYVAAENLFTLQAQMIKYCHEYLKPVFVQQNVLDSMVSSLLPSFCEITEISNLVYNFVDNIMLSEETSCGDHPLEAVKTLKRICLEAEQQKENELFNNFQQLTSTNITVQSCILECAKKAAGELQAKAIIVFTSRVL
ncbi:pyruvate kinase, putative [Ichthyophthirius multifiliis]|uniref:Pyruvate kinase n=1 Tax=Ichthyophthirius multifiliis TaxID=5932 RepID=G0R4X3_ICHMU|nr:pyruvate kinase, putative [Ichthyophthirius multifiliis]EGR27483.1 pyruvate kinase, putative [Ichthyophthirius multifiliis]|eukprot:XP_004024393.1 pyruvate kinase, putative [Ichthyophthirius multifiliis]